MVRTVRDPEFWEIYCDLPREGDEEQIDNLIEYRTLPRSEIPIKESNHYNPERISRKRRRDGKF